MSRYMSFFLGVSSGAFPFCYILNVLFLFQGALFGEVASSYDSNQMFTGVFTAMAGGTFIFISLNELIPKAFKKRQVGT